MAPNEPPHSDPWEYTMSNEESDLFYEVHGEEREQLLINIVVRQFKEATRHNYGAIAVYDADGVLVATGKASHSLTLTPFPDEMIDPESRMN